MNPDGPATATVAARRPASPRLIALIVACGLFMEQLDTTVLATALPAMAKSFHADPVHMSTALTAYLLSLAIFTPVSGQVADKFGARRVFCSAIILFLVGSVLCAQSVTLTMLVGARIIQGLGGAMMVPVGRLVLLRSVKREEMVSAIAWMLVPGMAGPVLGPPLGGIITTYLSWQWIFYINLPIGLLGLVMVRRYIAEVREPGGPGFDVLGIILSGTSLSCLMFGLEMTTRGVLPVVDGLGVIAVGVIAAVLYLRHARHHRAPVLDPALMRIPTFAVSVISGSLFRIGFGSLPFLLPLLMQLDFGLSAAASGMITFAAAGGAVLMKIAAQPFLRWLGFRRTFIFNGLLSAGLLALCGILRPVWPLPAIYALLLVCGFFSSLQFTAYNTVAYAELSSRQMSGATSFYATFQQFCLTLGITVAAGGLSILSVLRHQIIPDFTDFTLVFAMMGAFVLASVPVAARLRVDAGADMLGRVVATK